MTRPALYNGVMCIGTVFVDSRGRVRSCKLALDSQMAGHRLPRITVVRFDTAGRLMTAFLSREVSIQNHVLRAGVNFPIQFFPNGKVKSGYLAYDDTFDRVHCRRALDDGPVPIEFHDNGRLARCEASGDSITERCIFRRGDVVQLDPGGAAICPRR